MTALLSEQLVLPSPAIRTVDRPLVERLASRVACSVDEVAAFTSVARALEALATQVFAGRRVAIGAPAAEGIAARAWSAARSAREVDARQLDTLVTAARESDVLVLSSPVSGSSAAVISPRDLLLLRSRAPRPIIVLDLLDEDRARTPLTQPALLLPGTILLRGFGPLWRQAGASHLADIAFVAGPRDLVGPLAAPALPESLVAAACAEFDQTDIDRRVRDLAAQGRQNGGESLVIPDSGSRLLDR